jgi:hypothetical protein
MKACFFYEVLSRQCALSLFLFMWVGLALLAFLIALIALAVITADKFCSEFCFGMSCSWRILIFTAFIIFLRHVKRSFRQKLIIVWHPPKPLYMIKFEIR